MAAEPRQGVFGPHLVVPLIAGVLVFAHAQVIERLERFDFMGWPGVDRRLGFYALVATAATLLAAVVSTGLGLYLSSTNPRLEKIRERAGQRGRRVWTRALLALLLVTGVSLVAYIAEPARGQPDLLWPRMLVLWALLVVLVRVGYAIVFYVAQVHTSVEGTIRPQKPSPPSAVDLRAQRRRDAS